METLKVPQGEFNLARYPANKKDQLRAWDAADEYLLNFIHDENILEKASVLIVNDGFGTLTIALSQNKITLWTDSYLAQEGARNNLISNNITIDNIKIKNSIETPNDEYSVIIIKIPKSLALLEEQLIHIQSLVSSTTKIIAAGMVKTIHNSTLKLFEKYLGTTKTSLAKKKARLIFSEVNKDITLFKSPYPKKYTLENTEFEIFNYANVFSRESLDIGTRFFLKHLPQSDKYKTIIDLGCGNGVVGLIAAEKNPNAELNFVDASFMAVQSSRETFQSAFNSSRKATFKVGDCLSGFENNYADLILNNPPFHQDNAVGGDVAWKMFKQSRDVLKQNGELWVIGNQHLGYHVLLKKLFNNCEVIASNKKFVIMRAIKQ